MNNSLDSLFEGLEKILTKTFFEIHFEILYISEMKGPFYVLIGKPRGKMLNEDLANMLDSLRDLSEKIYNEYYHLRLSIINYV